MKNLAIVQARIGSTRLPFKVLKKIGRKSIIEILLDRLLESKKTDKVIVAIPKKNNSVLKKLLIKNKIDFFAGSEKNVLERYYKAALKFKGKNIIRITSDCPLIEDKLVEQSITLYENSNSDYTSKC